MGILANCGVTDSRIKQLHPESWSLENPLSKTARSILKGFCCFHMQFLRLGSVLYLICDCLPWFHHLQNGILLKPSVALRMLKGEYSDKVGRFLRPYIMH